MRVALYSMAYIDPDLTNPIKKIVGEQRGTVPKAPKVSGTELVQFFTVEKGKIISKIVRSF